MAQDLSGLDAPGQATQGLPFALIVSITLTGIMSNTLITPATPDIVEDHLRTFRRFGGIRAELRRGPSAAPAAGSRAPPG